MTDMAMGRGGSFDIGRVIERTFKVLGANFVTLLGLAILLAALPQALAALATPTALANPFALAPLAFVGGIAMIIGSFVLQAAVVHASVVDLNGGKASFGQSLSTGLSHFWPVVGISILVALGVGFGVILLIVPGLMMATAWVVAVPARVMEKTGVFQSISRSADLTRGYRWPVFGLLFIYFVLAMIIGGIGGLIVGGIGMASGDTDMTVFRVVFSPLINALSSMIGASGVAAIYYELRSKKEGVAPQELAAVFD